ncbi:hypothetical protein [Halomicrobium salinisoli]|uniref:hypothetical protein n=1 Tax=Halomicrobium salinisoli TaxID=2878391 RepID=UPI001CF08596|nr:hypothetical protein [Halomicrobium salinisoli]
MSDSQAYEEVTVASDGVTVTKRYEADEFPVPAIAFNFRSERGEPVTVHLSDVVPEDVAVEDLGFHPEYGSEFWTIDDDEISFEREIEPDSEYTTVYGIRATGTDNVKQFLTEPTLESVDPPLEDDEGELVGDGTDAVKDVISGDADSVPGLDDVDDEDIETLDLKDPNGEGGQRSNGQAEASGDAGQASAAAAASGSVVEAMAEEIRNQNVDKEDVELLRKALDLAGEETGGSVQARVEKLQTDVSEVLAYTDALEEFLDENGTGDQMLEEFREEVESFESDLEEFRSTVSDNEEALSELSSDVETVVSEVDDVGSQVESVESQVGDVESQVDDVDSQVDDLAAQVEDYESELEELREQATSEDVEGRLEEISEDIEELQEWREQLSSVIGGGE